MNKLSVRLRLDRTKLRSLSLRRLSRLSLRRLRRPSPSDTHKTSLDLSATGERERALARRRAGEQGPGLSNVRERSR
jgi:hypothetical protein